MVISRRIRICSHGRCHVSNGLYRLSLLGMELADVHIALTKDKPLVHGGIHVWHAMRND